MIFVVNVESTICTIECTEKHIDNGKQCDCGYYIALGVQYYYSCICFHDHLGQNERFLASPHGENNA